jgi:hypothetical protein
MHPLTHHVAVTRSLADGAPRIIVQQNAMYLVTPEGEVWQMFDTDGSGWLAGGIPRNDAAVLARIFVRADDALVRIYRFGIGERRSTTAWHMLVQLERAKAGDERAA